MRVQNISQTSNAYVFDNIEDYTTNVFTLEKHSRVFIIDTFCGSESMVPILARLKDNLADKELVVINTHFHWDHVWGNCCFNENKIISHRLCRNRMDELWDLQIRNNGSYIMGRVEKRLPDITFDERLFFHNDGIELFYSPGHTSDSISVFDHDEKVLYVGDNLEKPIIYVESEDVETYIETLVKYLSYSPRKIVASHTLEISEADIHNTINYLKFLSKGEKVEFNTEYEKKIHDQNLDFINRNK